MTDRQREMETERLIGKRKFLTVCVASRTVVIRRKLIKLLITAKPDSSTLPGTGSQLLLTGNNAIKLSLLGPNYKSFYGRHLRIFVIS